MKTEILDKLWQVNRRRRVRTIDKQDIGQAIREARRQGYGYRSGGFVANAYQYPADTAAVAAVKVDRSVWLKFGCHDAHRNSSPVTWWGPKSRRETDIKLWLDKTSEKTLEDGGWIELTAWDIRELTSGNTSSAELIARPDLINADIFVTKEDSFSAGNCVHETNRVAEWFPGRQAVKISALLKKIRREDPSLLRYAIKAAEKAIAREMETVA